ncbi:MAG: J domain-containing protein [Massilia sp.]|nr:J domain-containing protein [Massilia sp.]
MAKIHTHYDNLKVARKAPQEVIRAAYKALSQKYHPDKNQCNAQAARIMAIINTAYGILGEPARRKEHDDWIAAEEWEIAWLESTRVDEGATARPGALADPAETPPQQGARSWRGVRHPAWWGALLLGFAAGCAASLLSIKQPTVLPAALAAVVQAAVGPRAEPIALADPAPAPHFAPAIDARAGTAALSDGVDSAAQARDIKVLAVTGLVVPSHAFDCAGELHAPAAPNGEPWPSSSGYVDGYPVGNPGDEMQLRIDNTANPVAVFVRLYDLDRHAYARHSYVLAREALVIDQLAAGKYEVRYHNVVPDGTLAECAARRPHALKQAAVAP